MMILYSVLALVLVVLLAASFAKKTFRVHREIVIAKPSNQIYEYVRFLNNHKSFSKWVTKDSAWNPTPLDGDGTIGYRQPWLNYEEKAGVGELEIKGLTPNRRVVLVHHYLKPMQGRGESEITLESYFESETLVRWIYSGYTKYPLNLLTAILDMDKIIGKDLDTCLRKLDDKLTA